MRRARRGGSRVELGVTCGVSLCITPAFDGPPCRQVAVDQIVRRGLVGDEVGSRRACTHAPHEFGQHFGRIAEQPDRHGLALCAVLPYERQRVVEVARLLVDVACAQAEVEARLLAFDRQRDRAGERRRKRLRTAHATQPRRQYPAAAPVSAEVLPAGFAKGLIGALHDALAADVDPRAGRHLAEHHQAFAVEFVEVLPGRPLRHEVRVGDQHARSVGMRLEYADGLARLHKQRFVVVELAQCGEDGVETGPVARGAADAAIDDEPLRVFGDFGIEVVLQHPIGCFGEPALARK